MLIFVNFLLLGGRNTYNWMTGNSMDTFASVPSRDEGASRSTLNTKRRPEQIKNLFAILKKRPSAARSVQAPEQEPTSSMS